MPDWRRIVRQRLAALPLNPAAESDLAEELANHLETRYDELCSGGMEAADACRETLSQLDDLRPLQAGLERIDCMPKHELTPAGSQSHVNMIEDLRRDLGYAMRTIRKAPAFAVFVILTLALGIGANTTVFTIVNTLLLQPLPVADQSKLTAIGIVSADRGSRTTRPLPMSYADLEDYQTRNDIFESLAGYSSLRTVTWQRPDGTRALFAELVTTNYFSTLGLRAARGRFFAPEDKKPDRQAVVVLNHGTWQTVFGGTDDIIGRTVQINQVPFTVIGVAPPHFIGINAIAGPDVWLPAPMAERLFSDAMRGIFTDRTKAMFRGVGRLNPGHTRAQAQAGMSTIASMLARDYPATNEGRTVVVEPIREALFPTTGSRPIALASGGLLAVVFMVLLIACSNVANLLLARSAAREHEIAVRLSLGASRSRLIRQLLTESLLLAVISGAAAVFVGYAGLRILFSALPSAVTFVSPKLDATVWSFLALVSLASGLLFGILPALKTSRANVAGTLKDEARTTGKTRRKVTIAGILLVGQVAFSFLLIATAGLFIRSIQHAYDLDPGFRTDRLAVFITSPGQAGYPQARGRAFYRDVRDRIRVMPGVESVSWASNMPLWARPVSGLQIEGRPLRSATDTVTTIVNTVTDQYFQTIGTPITRGRAFTDLDREASMPVAVVNETLARDAWPDGAALGKRIRLPGESQWRAIVGVAKTANYSAWGEPAQPCVYLPLEQNYLEAMTLYVRTSGEPQQIVMPVERAVAAAAPDVLVSGVRTGREIVDGGLFQARMGVALLSVFGVLALVLATVGLYGIVAYSVNRRRREIGLRMALGASGGTVVRLVLMQGMWLVIAGVVLGCAAALLTGRVVSRLLYGISGGDPLTVSAAAAVLLSAALLACYLPARRASRVDPLLALREG